MTGTAPSWIWATVWFAVAIALIIIAIWSWDKTASHHWIRKSMLTVLAAGLMGYLSYIPVSQQYRKEHPKPIPVAVKPKPPEEPKPVVSKPHRASAPPAFGYREKDELAGAKRRMVN